ncbi:MAG: glycosyltransferase family 9 protein [Bdellovibrionaceae bacterium]|nr:glycosyltransferase family 9 protein [Bdellovibrio sp.]
MKTKKAHVVIQTAFFGDLILSIPLFRRIKKMWPQHDLVIVCKKGLGDFLLKEKIVDRCLEVVKGDRLSYRQALRELNSYHVKNVYCVHRSTRSLLFTAQIKAEKKIGYASFMGFWVLDELIEFITEWPEVMRLMKILESTDPATERALRTEDWQQLNHSNPAGELPFLPTAFAFEKKEQVNDQLKPAIALFPGSVWATKKWMQEGYAAVARYFLNKGYAVDLMGGPDEKVLCELIAGEARGAQVLAGQLSISESIKRVANYQLVICNDSASTHMASYQHVPVVSIFGPTTLDLGFRPWTNKARIIENKNLDCRPCGKHGHDKCPLGHHHCMKHISPDMVIAAAEALLIL